MNKLKVCKIVITSMNFALFIAAVVFSIVYGTTRIGAYTYAATGCFLLVAVLSITFLVLEKKFGKNTTNDEENVENDKNNKKED